MDEDISDAELLESLRYRPELEAEAPAKRSKREAKRETEPFVHVTERELLAGLRALDGAHELAVWLLRLGRRHVRGRRCRSRALSQGRPRCAAFLSRSLASGSSESSAGWGLPACSGASQRLFGCRARSRRRRRYSATSAKSGGRSRETCAGARVPRAARCRDAGRGLRIPCRRTRRASWP